MTNVLLRSANQGSMELEDDNSMKEDINEEVFVEMKVRMKIGVLEFPYQTIFQSVAS